MRYDYGWICYLECRNILKKFKSQLVHGMQDIHNYQEEQHRDDRLQDGEEGAKSHRRKEAEDGSIREEEATTIPKGGIQDRSIG